MKDSTYFEKMALLVLAGGCVGALTWIALDALHAAIDANAATLIGVIAGGLIAGFKDIVAAVRAYSMSAQLGKVTDQLAASGPAISPIPPDIAAAAQTTADAAQDQADAIKDGSV